MNGKTNTITQRGLLQGDGSKPATRGAIFVTFTASIINDRINLFESDNLNGQIRNRTFEYQREDDETFILPNDTSLTDRNMMIGIGQRLNVLQRYGFSHDNP